MQKGFILTEVLVAWFIVSSLIMLMLLLVSKQSVRIQRISSQAIAFNQLNNFLEQLQVLPPNLRELKEAQWYQQNQQLLPNSIGQVSCHSMFCTVCLRWKNLREPLCLSGAIYVDLL